MTIVPTPPVLAVLALCAVVAMAGPPLQFLRVHEQSCRNAHTDHKITLPHIEIVEPSEVDVMRKVERRRRNDLEKRNTPGTVQHTIAEMREIQARIDAIDGEWDLAVNDARAELTEMQKDLRQHRDDSLLGVPGFWSGLVLRHPQLVPLMAPQDAETLQALDSITVLEDAVSPATTFTVTFNFQPNDFFTNTQLRRRCVTSVQGSGGDTGQAVVYADTASDVDWLPTRRPPRRSLFYFFEPPVVDDGTVQPPATTAAEAEARAAMTARRHLGEYMPATTVEMVCDIVRDQLHMFPLLANHPPHLKYAYREWDAATESPP